MTARPCWNCRQPATHTLTREGSLTLNACDNCTRIDHEEAQRRGWTITPIGQWVAIGPRIDEFENDVHHFWKREINGIRFFFVHVKQSRLGQPYIGVTRLDTDELVRCSCPRDDCPFTA